MKRFTAVIGGRKWGLSTPTHMQYRIKGQEKSYTWFFYSGSRKKASHRAAYASITDAFIKTARLMLKDKKIKRDEIEILVDGKVINVENILAKYAPPEDK